MKLYKLINGVLINLEQVFKINYVSSAESKLRVGFYRLYFSGHDYPVVVDEDDPVFLEINKMINKTKQ